MRPARLLSLLFLSLLPVLFLPGRTEAVDPVLGPTSLVDPGTRRPGEQSMAVARDASDANYLVAVENLLGCGSGIRSALSVLALPTSGVPATQGALVDSVDIYSGSVDGPDIAVVGTSDYLVVWLRYAGSDGNVWGVRVDDSGVPVEAPFLVLDRAESFGRPSVVGLPDGSARVAASTSVGIYVNTVPSVGAPGTTTGSFVVSGGSSDLARDASSGDILCVYLATSQVRCIAQFGGVGAWSASALIASGFSVAEAQVAPGGSSQFLAVFDILPRLYAARISTTGGALAVLDAGGFSVESGTGQVLSPQVAHDGFNYQVLWTESYTLDVSENLWTARIAGDGTVMDSPPVAIRAGIDVVLEPAIGGEGTPLLVWSEKLTYYPGGDEHPADLFGRRRSATGLFPDASPRSIWKPYHVDNPTVTHIESGVYAGYTIAWADGRAAEPGSEYDVYLAHVDDDGLLFATDDQFCGVGNNQFFPAVADDGENFVVAWFDQATNDLRGVSSHDGFSGSPEGKLLWDGTASVFAASPSLAWNGVNYLLVSGTTTSPDASVAVVLLDEDASVLATTTIDRAGSDLNDPHVASDGDGFLVVYRIDNASVNNILGRRVDASGVLVGSVISICAASGIQTYPGVTFDGANYVVVWEDHRGVGADIYAGRVSRSGVPLDGNGFPVVAEASDQIRPDVTHNGFHSMVVYEDVSPSAVPRGAYVDLSGGVLPDFTISGDPGGFVTAAGSGGGGSLAVWSQLVLVPDPGGWRPVARTVKDLDVVGVEERENVPATLSITGSPGPGPFTFAMPTAGVREFRIFDASGRVVLARGMKDPTDFWRWDGRNEAGKTLPAGIYFLEADGNGNVLRGRVVIVR